LLLIRRRREAGPGDPGQALIEWRHAARPAPGARGAIPAGIRSEPLRDLIGRRIIIGTDAVDEILGLGAI